MLELFARGQRVAGRYRIERGLGRGGMAVVYLAEDEAHGRSVAVKALLPKWSGLAGSNRFHEEIRTTAGLAHPHVLPLLDSGVEDGILYYVSPYVTGESLRDRLRREERLGLEETLSIGRALASALAHAHAAGTVHRDVKPGNILLDSAGNPYLSDFGIAQALSADSRLRTTEGVLIGTPQYMSPEQFSESAEVGPATDIYSLGCVLYEALAGRAPFTPSTIPALITAHLFTDPPPLSDRVAGVPAEVERLILSMLSKDPSDRPADAGTVAALLDDLRAAVHSDRSTGPLPGPAAPRVLRRRGLVAAGAAAALLAAVAMATRSVFLPPPPAVPPDTTRYAVLPFATSTDLAGLVPPEILLRDALDRWEGIEGVDLLLIRDQLAQFEVPTRPSPGELATLATALDAGRVVLGRVDADGDSLRVEVRLLDTTAGARTITTSIHRAAADLTDLDRAVTAAAQQLLFRGAIAGSERRQVGTSSAAALRQYGLGEAELLHWNLLEAERRFRRALDEDPWFAEAALWRAQVASWLGRPVAAWEDDARRASGDESGTLRARDRMLAQALQSMADGDFPEACRTYEALGREDPRDFAAWFGMGECRRRDPVVLRDTTATTGWRFRGSAHAATEAYRRALEDLPSSFRAFGSGGMRLVRARFYADGRLRAGQASPPSAESFYGFPEWRGDSLVFAVVPFDQVPTYRPDETARAEALVRQRRVLLGIADSWVRAFPESGDALFTLATARELIGDPSAGETYRRARTLTADPVVWATIAAAEVTLSIRRSLPHDLDALRQAAALADSVLASPVADDPALARTLATLAVARGRPAAAAGYLRRSGEGSRMAGTPPEVGREADALMAFAAAGGPMDSLQALERRTEEGIRRAVPPSQQDVARAALLALPSLLAYPTHTLAFTQEANPRSMEAQALQLLLSGDTARAVESVAEVPVGLTWDMAMVRANILASAGRTGAALQGLRERFGGLGEDDPVTTGTVARVGGLIRAAALRARLEASVSPDSAAQWARAVLALWAPGEEGVVRLVQELDRILDRVEGE